MKTILNPWAAKYLNLHGSVISANGRKYRIEYRENRAIYPYAHIAYSLDAKDLQAEKEGNLFIFTDLIRSEGKESEQIFLSMEKALTKREFLVN